METVKSEMNGLREIVKNALEISNQCRNDDTYLWFYVCESLNPVVSHLDFSYVATHRTDLGIPRQSSVSRTRRLLQREYPHLRADEEVQEARKRKKEQFKMYCSNI